MQGMPWLMGPPLLGRNGPVQAWAQAGSSSAPMTTRMTVTLGVSDTASQAGGSAGNRLILQLQSHCGIQFNYAKQHYKNNMQINNGK